jgi:hypothetical protein
LPLAPRSREHAAGSPLAELQRLQFRHHRDLILLQTHPLVDEDTPEHLLCQLLERSARNQQKILEQIEKLALMLSNSGHFVTGCWEVMAAAQQAEILRGDLAARFEFLQGLEKNLATGVEHFPQLPAAG